MSPLGQMLSNFLKSNPGPFRGDTSDAAIRAAFDAGIARGHIRGTNFQDFKDGMERVGYSPVERRSGTGYVWCFNLPEGM
jgi:hypothetical protein